MKSQIKKKVLRTSLFTVALAVVGLVTGTAGTATAKSLYLAMDSASGYLFVTYEDSNVIQVINARTAADEGIATAPGAVNLAGIVYDHDKRLLYCAERGSNKLYVYDWNATTKTLTNMTGSPFTLAYGSTYGIALDEINDRLYAATHSNMIRVYNTSGWSLAGTISITPLAISVAVDATNGLLYSGAGFLDDYDIALYELSLGKGRRTRVDPNAGVIGLAVDPATGFVYVSTGKDGEPGGDNLVVFDTSLKQIDAIGVNGNPTGLVVPSNDISYNPLNLSKEIIDGVEDLNIGDTITYEICFDNNDNDFTVHNVLIVGTLPDEVDFVTADGNGVPGLYDPAAHTCTWTYLSLEPGSGACLELVVQVNERATAGATIISYATIYSDELPPTTTSAGIDTKDISYKALNLSKHIVGEPNDVDIGDTITYDICFDNNDNDFAVTSVSIIDTLPEEVNFVTADGNGVFGYYDPAVHTYAWSYTYLAPGTIDCLQLTVRVNEGTAPATTIANLVTISSSEIPPTGASVDITTKDVIYEPLNLNKIIVGEPNYVDVGDIITYDICFDNNDNDLTVANVSIVDILPDEVNFVTADGNGVFGQYDPNTHTYTWSDLSLEPGAGDCLRLVVQVNEETEPNTTIANFVTIDSNETPSTTTSVDVVTQEVVYNAFNLSASIVGEPNYVDIGDTITYDICFDNNDNDQVVYNASIVNILADEVSFVIADGNGSFGWYDPNVHTYTWSRPSVEPGTTICLNLTVRVNQDTEPNTTVTNFVTIDSEETPSTTTSVGIVAREVIYEPLNLSKTIVDEVECVDANSTITYSICFDNNDNDATVNNVSIVDSLPEQVSFVTADGDGLLGQYDPNTHTYAWSYPPLEPGAGECLELTVRVNEGTPEGTTITNSVTIDSNETPPLTASVDVTVCESGPLEADLCIFPKLIERTRPKRILAILEFPAGVGVGDIKDQALILEPGDIEASHRHAYARGSRVRVISLFDGRELRKAVPGYGRVKLRVAGKLKSGRAFYGEQDIFVTRPARRRVPLFRHN